MISSPVGGRALRSAVAAGFGLLVAASAGAVTLDSKVSNVSGNVQSGTSITYTLTYRCDKVVGTCSNVTITDQFPAGFSVNPANVQAAPNTTFTSVDYDQPTRTVTWTAPSIAAGQTGQLDLELLIPAGSTPNGTVLTNSATIAEPGFPLVTATVPDPVTVTAINTFQPEKQVATGGAVGGPTRWFIGLRNTSTTGLGVLDLSGPITFTDVLPEGVVLTRYEAIRSGSSTANCSPALAALPVTAGPGGLTVTCTYPGGIAGTASPNGFIAFYTLKVVYPSPAFATGDVSVNNISYNATALGNPNATVGPVARNITLAAPAANGSLGKGVNVPQVVYDVADPLGWNISLSNNGNVINDSNVITDTLPSSTLFTLQSFTIPGSAANPITAEYELANSGTFIATGLANPYSSSASIASVPGGIANITRIRWTLAGSLEPSEGVTVAVHGVIPAGVPTNTAIQNCSDATFSGLVGSVVTAFTRNACSSVTTEAPRARLDQLNKNVSTSQVNPNGVFDYTITFANRGNRRFTNFVISDVLDPRLELVQGAFGGQDFQMDSGPAPTTFQYVPATNTVTASYAVLCPVINNPTETSGTPPCSATPNPMRIRIRVRVLPGTPATQPQVPTGPPAITNTATITADQALGNPGTTPVATLSVRANAEIASEKLVKGALDTVFSKVPDVGRTTQGGALTYQFRITNLGNVAMQNIVIVDVLPNTGDTGIFDPTARDSHWRPVLTAPIAPPAPLTVEYSTTPRPCTPELGTSLPSCSAPNWTSVFPGDPTTIYALRFNFNSKVLQPAESVIFSIVMKAPVGSPTYDGPFTNPPAGANIAWNNFAFISTRSDNGNSLSAEPNKVGIAVPTDLTHVSVGNYIWFDDNGGGTQDEAKTGAAARGVNGVRVFLLDSGGNPVPDANDPTGFLSTITGPDFSGNPGYYLFAGLDPGTYAVAFDPTSFPTAWSVTRKNADGLGLGPLGTDSQASGGLNSDADGTSTVTVTIAGNPRTLYRTTTTSLPTGGNQNLSLDLGLVPGYSLGNRVWLDTNNNGVINSGEVGKSGVALSLLQESAPGSGTYIAALDTAGVSVPAQTTDANGYYRFDNLPPGRYKVSVDASNFAPASGTLAAYRSSTDIGSTANPDNDTDSEDNGVNAGAPQSAGVLSNPVTLGVDGSHPSPDSEPTGETDLAAGSNPQGGTDARGNMTVDFGFNRIVIGNRVWFDNGLGPNTNNGIFDAGELPVAGLLIELRDAGSNALIATTVTDGSGLYQFDRTSSGDALDPALSYVVQIPVPPGTSISSTPVVNGPATGLDERNNGTQPGGAGTPVRSAAFTVVPGAATGGQTVAQATGTTTQPTVDFGFSGTPGGGFSLGNRVWFDTDNNGILDGSETGVAGVRVEILGTGSTLVAATLTDATGYYRVDGLSAGTYTVRIAASNFQSGATLAGYRNSTPTTTSTGNTLDSRDNGVDVPNPTVVGVTSAPVTLGPNLQPVAESDKAVAGAGTNGPNGDGTDNLTVDFGFYRIVIGNVIWFDTGPGNERNNGIFDAGESPIPNVRVELRNAATNQLVAATVTDAAGMYRFDRTTTGDPLDSSLTYYVNLPTPPGLPAKPVTDGPGSGEDSHNNGQAFGSAIRSAVFTVTPGSTAGGQLVDGPTGTTTQPTLDFGVIEFPAPIPALKDWALLVLAMLVGLLGAASAARTVRVLNPRAPASTRARDRSGNARRVAGRPSR